MSMPSAAVPLRGGGALARLARRGARLALLFIVVVGALAASSSATERSQPSPIAIADIPTDYLVAVRARRDCASASTGRSSPRSGRSSAITAALEAPGCNPPGTVNARGATGPMQFLGSTWRSRHAADDRSGARAARGEHGGGYATDGDGDGIADVWNPADAIAGAARLLRANGAPADYRARGLRLQPRRLVRRRVLAKADEYRGAFARARRAARVRLSPGRSRTSGASRYSRGRPPIAAARCRTCRAASRRARRATARCSPAGRWRRRASTSASTTVSSGRRTVSCPTPRRPSRLPLVARGVGPDPPPGGYRPGDLIFFGHGAGGERPRRALARRRPDRPVLVERRRLEHPAARRLRRADGLGALDVTG